MNNDFNNDFNNGFEGQDNSNGQKEEIRFDEWDGGRNPYSSREQAAYGGWHYNARSETLTPIDEAAEKQHLSRLGIGFATFTLISTLAAMLIQIIVANIAPDFYQTTLFLNILSPVALYIFALPVLLMLVANQPVKTPEKRKMGVGEWLLYLVIGFGVMYIGAMIGNTVMDYISAFVGFDYSNGLEAIIDEDNIWMTAIFTVIIAPIGEELIFRKLLIDRTQKYGGAVCVLLSALIFGLMHGNLYQFFYCFGIGLILAYMYHSSGRILPCILLHATINFLGSVVPTWLSPILEALDSIDPTNAEALAQFIADNALAIVGSMLFSLVVYAAMALAIVLPIRFRRKIKLGAPEVAIPRGRRMAVIFGGSGMIVMLIVYGLEFVLSLLPY